MHYVYILKSMEDSNKIYVGVTNNIERRLRQHNITPTCAYTKSYAPWNMIIYTAFRDQKKAFGFEKYLKSHAGKAFLKKHLI
ncbi:MAG: GIY-YIG nuclease family protein [Candidatus Omnitrophica bacterium]|nr:GIY-YIG nuclease family protein [Candidatus Omnitrophota bacterium]